MATDNEVQRVVERGQIDRSSAMPLYHQLEYLIRKDIEDGRYGPGDSLPSEGEICARYEVSRSVVRQTLTNLIHAGLIRTERGRGSFVAEKKLHERFVQRATGLYDDLRRMGYDVRTHVVRQEVVELPPPVREFLQARHGVQIDRVRSINGRVLAFIRSFVRADACPGLEDAELEDRSLYKLLADRYGLRVATGRRTVEAVAADNHVGKHLDVPNGEPLLLLRSSSRDENGRPLEWFEAWHRGDRTMFEIEIIASEVDQPFSTVRPGLDQKHEQPPASPTASATPAHGDLVTDALRRSRVVAVLNAPQYGAPVELARQLATRGVSVLEVGLGARNALAAIEAMRDVDDVVVGAATVTSAETAKAAIAAGAQFLVAPAGALDVMSAADTTPVLFTGFTMNEVWAAWQATSAPVKVLPASVGGPEYVSTLHSQMPDIPLLPAGGVTLDNAADYLRAGAAAVVIGEALCPADALASGDVGTIAERVSRLREALTT